VAVAVLTTPALALLIMAGGWFGVQRARRRVPQRHRRQIATGLPDLVDLLLLCTSAGLAMPVAQASVAARTDGALGAALRAADQAAQAGRARADCLIEALSPLGDPAARLAHVIADHLRYGVPLAPGLERLGAELKLERRRRAEEDARRVPVRLLGPLVACVLPAFGLLTVVPLLAASLRALPT
jgi:tight adherence protein C